MKVLSILCLLLIITANSFCQKGRFGEPDIIEINDSSSLVDAYMGDWLGTWLGIDGKESALAIQVIGLGKSNYQVNLSHSFNSPNPPFIVAKCFIENGELLSKEITGSDHEWDFEIRNSNLIGKANNGAHFFARRVTRVSPTLGQKPPSDAVILFDGSNLDNWQLMREFNGHLHIPGSYTGNCCNYLKTRLWSDVEQKVKLQTAHNSMMKFWLNNDLVYNENSYIAPVRSRNEKNTDIFLRKGWNELFVKIVGYNVTSAAIRIISKDDRPLANIAEENLSSDLLDKTNKFLAKADQHLTAWQYSGHYFIESPEKKNLMLEAFAHKFTPESNPSGAIWKPLNVTLKEGNIWPMQHRLVDGTLEIYQSGDLMTRQNFTNYLLHIEFRIPFDSEKTGQHRGNSGVYLHCQYEIQVLDSYGLSPTKQDCGAAYYIKAPDVNMSLPPMQWQTYDIEFHAPHFDEGGNKFENARATVYHNGVRIHDNIEFSQPTGGGNESRTA